MERLQLPNSIKNQHIVCATPLSLEDFNEKSQLGLFIDKFSFQKQSTIITNNKEGLSKVYNSFITEENRNKNIIFVHDDVLIEDLFFAEKLEIAFEKFDIVGLAGSKTCDLNSINPAWHQMCEKKDMVGEVSHAHNKNIWTSVYGPTNSRALILDGLFIAVNVARLLKTETFFDEDFDFHHYDIAFCLRANVNKLKMGVAPIRAVHFGLGDSMNTKEWRESAARFKLKYN